MAKNRDVWFVVADAAVGRLMQCNKTPAGRVHVEEYAAIAFEEAEHEHGRPSPLRPGAHASEGHEDEQRLHRFAKEVVAWLDKHAGRFDSQELTLFAPPKFLGELRKLYSPGLAARIREHRADLTGLTAARMAAHPAVTQLLPDG